MNVGWPVMDALLEDRRRRGSPNVAISTFSHLKYLTKSDLGLSIVNEISANDDQNIDPQLKQLVIEPHTASNGIEHNSNHDYASEALQQQLREASSASAVTGQTSFSQQELRDLDSEAMLDALPDLHHAACDVIRLVVPGEIETGSQVQRLSDKTSREHKKLRRLGKAHLVQKEGFGTEQYINPHIAILGIFELQDHDRIVHPLLSGLLNIFYLSNIASSFVGTFTLHVDAFIEQLDSKFASVFLTEVDFPRQTDYGVNGHSGLRRETVDLALDIRTQHCISLLKRNLGGEHNEMDELIRQCFFAMHDEPGVSLKGWDTKGIRTSDLLEFEQRDIGNRIAAIRDVLGKTAQMSKNDTLEFLKDNFRWSAVQAKFIQWANRRVTEIEKEINALGGVEKVRTDIEATRAQGPGDSRSGHFDALENNSRRTELEYNPPIISHTLTDAAEPRFATQQKPPMYVILRKPLSGRAKILYSHTNPQAHRMLYNPDLTAKAALRLQPENRDPSSALAPSHEVGLAERNQENLSEPLQPVFLSKQRLIDPQIGAERITFDTQDSALPGPSTQHNFRNPDQIGDHAKSDFLPEPSQDEGFQTDTRPSFQRAPVPNMQRSREEIIPTRPRKRARNSRSISGARVATSAAPSTPQEQPSPMDLVSGTQAEIYAQVNTQSRLRASQISKPRKAKEPWTNDEINALVDYIAKLGFSCGKIIELDKAETGQKRLLRRDNVALKDKARNMKMDYLR